MLDRESIEIAPDHAAIAESLLQVAVNLSAVQDRRQLLDMILREARKLTQAEAGSLFVLEDGRLTFAASQNDSMSLTDVTDSLLTHQLEVSGASLAGFVASAGRVINIPDAYALSSGAPFRIDRRFDTATGYRTKSVLAIPLVCPDGQCAGVLELLNRIGAHGRIVPFPSDENSGVLSLASMAAVSIQNTLLQEQLKKAHLDSIIRLSVAAELRDDDTGMHVRRMSRCSKAIAQTMGLEPSLVELIEYASPMHDIGKIGIPDAILLKPGRLTPEERRVLETHAMIGAKIFADPQNELIAMAREVALTHHEKWDGTGYPQGLAGNRIPLPGRIVGLADVFDALISRRCYKEAFPVDEALEIIRRERGKHFDPNVTDAFLATLDEIRRTYEQAKDQDA